MPRPATHSFQAAANLAYACSLQTDPGENQTDNADLLFEDFEAGHPAAQVPADIAVSERSAGQRADRPGTRGMSAPPPAALQNLRSLVFRNHALNLEQEIIFRRAADRTVQKNDLRPRPVKLLDEKDLMRIAPGEPVRGVDINSRDDPTGHRIPQPFQRRTKQNRSAITFIHIGVVRHEEEAVGRDALPERRDLTGNRIVARLTVARHARIERDAISFDHDLSPLAIVVLVLTGEV